MSSKSLSVLAFASAALAVPHAQWQPFKNHGHGHYHSAPGGYGSESASAGYSSPVAPVSGSGTGAPYPYPTANATGMYGSTGTGYATGFPTYSSSVYPTTDVPSGMPSPVGPATASSVASYGEECSSDVTVTTTETETVYYTAGQSSSQVSPVSESAPSTVHLTSTYTAPAGYSASSESSSEVSAAGVSSSQQSTVHVTSTYTSTPVVYSSAPASSPVAPESSPASYSAPYSSSSSPVAPVSSSYSTPVSYAAPSSSSVYVAPTTTSSVYVAPTSYSSSTPAAAPTGYSTSTGFRGKRGLAYNDASLTSCLTSSDKVGWAYNWGSDASGFSHSDITYIPTLWGPTSDFTPSWNDNANAAIQNGAPYLFSFNEPDNPSQANLSPEDAASAWKQYMEPFAGKAKLVAPSVTNGGGSMGLDWLSAFLTACDGCTIDAVNQHWYDTTSNDADYFKEQISNATTVSGGKPVFVSEFGGIGSDSDISSFLQEVMPWMDGQDSVLGYAYFMVSDGLLVSGSEPSSYGSTFANYS